ncbi:hypothetical protein MNEG_3029 [Monoraphidium neglectum]|uniref:RPA43 OB domain-containing protein n=1 Tax=Monoraphidium neglectum TaxID=145388 RepID=A0A0D2MQI4_9CHLO|nr:hypothetical protein MNEG_3029 [Monoraphidium neglectum]KIZ04925.1 hypothetical protein MNEG_3029 [Monoraphidium neglectum]|eukprot:XP_013903944.1 hypothetical protein MNEG_3029 [Monoraphidium neglectum]
MSAPSTSGRDSERANSNALSTVTARFTLHLHPSKTQDVIEGVREQLNLGLLRYSEDLGGVVLAYSNERVTGRMARLHPYFPFLAVAVVARVTLFCPRPGQHLVGRVIKVGTDYVGLLVLGVFNAAIGAERIRREFKCSPEAGCWVSLRDATHRILVGSYVRFVVDSVLDHASLFSIVGSLLDAGTGEEGHCSSITGTQQALASKKAEQQQRPGSKDRHRRRDGEQQQQQQQQDGKAGKGKRKEKQVDKGEGMDKRRKHGAGDGTPAAKKKKHKTS